MKKIKFLLALVVPGALINVAYASGSILPPWFENMFKVTCSEGSCLVPYIVSRLQIALLLALGGVIIVAVVYAILAAFKYIRSEGDSGKMEEAQKSIKAIFMGIAALLIAIVGIVVVFVVFGATQPGTGVYQTCFSAPNSEGCKACNDSSVTGNADKCKKCEDAWALAAKTDDPIKTVLADSANGGETCVDPAQGGK
jgi:hypothetical protein